VKYPHRYGVDGKYGDKYYFLNFNPVKKVCLPIYRFADIARNVNGYFHNSTKP